MQLKLVTPSEFKAAAAEAHGKKPEGLGIYKDFVVKVGRATGERTLEVTISSPRIDRDRDTIDPKGWDFTDYRKNPVVLWVHSYDSVPVARSLSERVVGDDVVSVTEFMPADLMPFSHMLFRMYDEGFMNAFSVGFQPTEWKITEDSDRPFGYDYLKQSLLEYSCVPIPSNPDALVRAHGAGIDTAPLREWCERALDLKEKMKGLGRDDIERAWKAVSARAFILDLAPDPAAAVEMVRGGEPEPEAPESGAAPEAQAEKREAPEARPLLVIATSSPLPEAERARLVADAKALGRDALILPPGASLALTGTIDAKAAEAAVAAAEKADGPGDAEGAAAVERQADEAPELALELDDGPTGEPTEDLALEFEELEPAELSTEEIRSLVRESARAAAARAMGRLD